MIAAVLPQEANASTAPISAEHIALIERIRAVKVEVDRLVMVELDTETQPGRPGYRRYRRACHEAKRAEEQFDCLTVECLRRPVTTWGDVAVIAELALAHAERDIEGGLSLISNQESLIVAPFECDLRDYTMGTLMLAARNMGGTHV